MHGLGFLFCAVILLATRDRPRQHEWLWVAAGALLLPLALHGRTLELWDALVTLGMGQEPAGYLVRGLDRTLGVVAWLPLCWWALRGTLLRHTRPVAD